MELRLEVGYILDIEADCIVVNLFQGVTEPGGATGAVDQAMGGVIKQLIEDGDIKGKAGELTLVHTQGKIKPKRVVVAGLGKQDKMSTDTLRSLGGDVARFARGKGFSSVASIIHGAGIDGMDPEAAGQAFAEGVALGLYRFRRHFSEQDDDDDDSSNEISEFTLVEQDAARAAAVRGAILSRIAARDAATASGRARDWAIGY